MSTRPELALALVRIATGTVFVLNGWQKVFKTGLAGAAQVYAAADIPLPLLMAPVTATLELLGGLLLLVGLGARGLAGVLGGVTLVTGIALWAHGTMPISPAETDVLLIAGCAAVALGGAGSPAVDSWRPVSAVPRTRGRR